MTLLRQTSHPLNELKTDEDLIRFCVALGKQDLLEIPADATVQVHNISGNINRVRRVIFWDDETEQQQSLILKTLPAGGRLEKYPDIVFPESRLTYEHLYYRTIEDAAQQHAVLKAWTPTLLYTGNTSSDHLQTLVMNDLFPAISLQESILQGVSIADQFFSNLGHQLGLVHCWSHTSIKNDFPKNPSASANRPYVLTQPFVDSTALYSNWKRKPSESWRCDLQETFLTPYKNRLLPTAEKLMARFKHDPFSVLTHGDLHADSIFIQNDQPTVIDAELCDRGAAWFDTGMVVAHLWMLSAISQTPLSTERFLESYKQAFDKMEIPIIWPEFWKDTAQLAGFEVIRRILGVANMDYIEQKQAEKLLHLASQHILQTNHPCQPEDLVYGENTGT